MGSEFEKWMKENEKSVFTNILVYVDKEYDRYVGEVDRDDVRYWLKEAYEAGYKQGVKDGSDYVQHYRFT